MFFCMFFQQQAINQSFVTGTTFLSTLIASDRFYEIWKCFAAPSAARVCGGPDVAQAPRRLAEALSEATHPAALPGVLPDAADRSPFAPVGDADDWAHTAKRSLAVGTGMAIRIGE